MLRVLQRVSHSKVTIQLGTMQCSPISLLKVTECSRTLRTIHREEEDHRTIHQEEEDHHTIHQEEEDPHTPPEEMEHL